MTSLFLCAIIKISPVMIMYKMAELLSFLQTNSNWTYSYCQISLPPMTSRLMHKIWICFHASMPQNFNLYSDLVWLVID